jgi:hypothetical protein
MQTLRPPRNLQILEMVEQVLHREHHLAEQVVQVEVVL